jgi:hypothetical protein
MDESSYSNTPVWEDRRMIGGKRRSVLLDVVNIFVCSFHPSSAAFLCIQSPIDFFTLSPPPFESSNVVESATYVKSANSNGPDMYSKFCLLLPMCVC